jgi:hypothetical protein
LGIEILAGLYKRCLFRLGARGTGDAGQGDGHWKLSVTIVGFDRDRSREIGKSEIIKQKAIRLTWLVGWFC